MKSRIIFAAIGLSMLIAYTGVATAAQCPKSALKADVVAIDHPIIFNRLGAQNVNWMMYALRHDIVDLNEMSSGNPMPLLDYTPKGEQLFQNAVNNPTSRSIALRPDLRPRPLGGCPRIRLSNE